MPQQECTDALGEFSDVRNLKAFWRISYFCLTVGDMSRWRNVISFFHLNNLIIVIFHKCWVFYLETHKNSIYSNIQQSNRGIDFFTCSTMCAQSLLESKLKKSLLASYGRTCSIFSQRASFSLRVSVMKAKNLMAKDANGKTIQLLHKLIENRPASSSRTHLKKALERHSRSKVSSVSS